MSMSSDTTKKIVQASLAAFDEANVYHDIISYVLQKHALELSFGKVCFYNEKLPIPKFGSI